MLRAQLGRQERSDWLTTILILFRIGGLCIHIDGECLMPPHDVERACVPACQEEPPSISDGDLHKVRRNVLDAAELSAERI